MGHLLSTVNPAAADAIDNPPQLPDVGTIVVFKDRAGVTRMHRSEFPALVLGSHDGQTLCLMVILEAEDFKMEDRVPFRSHNAENFYWRYRRKGTAEEDGESELTARVALIEQVLASDEIEALEKRIAALEGKKKPGRKPKGK